MSKGSFKDTSLKMNKFPKKEPINFHKCYDSEGAAQLLLQTNHFAYLRSKFDDQYSCVAIFRAI